MVGEIRLIFMKRGIPDVTTEEIAVRLEGHEHEIGSLKRRMTTLEDQTKVIQELVLSVNELAINMKNMMEEQREQGLRLNKMESEPANKWRKLSDTAITTIISTIAGALITALIIVIGQTM